MADPHDLRDGEIAVELPETFDASVYFIGRIRTPWTRREQCPKNARGSDAVCTIEVDPRYAAGLTGVETCSHLLVLYWMDKARRDLMLQRPRHYDETRGTFALRSPVRPTSTSAAPGRDLGRLNAWRCSGAMRVRRRPSRTRSARLPRTS